MIDTVKNLIPISENGSYKKPVNKNTDSEAFGDLLAVLLGQTMNSPGNNLTNIDSSVLSGVESTTMGSKSILDILNQLGFSAQDSQQMAGMLGDLLKLPANEDADSKVQFDQINELLKAFYSQSNAINEDNSQNKGLADIMKILSDMDDPGNKTDSISKAVINALIKASTAKSDEALGKAAENASDENIAAKLSGDFSVKGSIDTKSAAQIDTARVLTADAKNDRTAAVKAMPMHSVKEADMVTDSSNYDNTVIESTGKNNDSPIDSKSSDKADASIKEFMQNTEVTAKQPEQDSEQRIDQFILQKPEILKLIKSMDGKTADAENSGETVKTNASKDGGSSLKESIGKIEISMKPSGKEEGESKSSEDGRNTFQTITDSSIKTDGSKAQQSNADFEGMIRQSKDTIMDQIFDRMKVISKGASEIHVSLKPDELGQVSIKLVMDKGVMVGKIFVENEQVKSLIESSLPQMKENLKNQNLDVSKFSVSVGLNQDDAPNYQFQGFNERRYMPGRRSISSRGFSPNTAGTAETRTQNAKGLVNMLV